MFRVDSLYECGGQNTRESRGVRFLFLYGTLNWSLYKKKMAPDRENYKVDRDVFFSSPVFFFFFCVSVTA